MCARPDGSLRWGYSTVLCGNQTPRADTPSGSYRRFLFFNFFNFFLRSARAGTDDERISVVGRVSSAPDRLTAMRERHYTGYGYIHPPQTYRNRPPSTSPGPSFLFLFSIARPGQCLLAWLAACKDARNTRARRSRLPFEYSIFESLFELERLPRGHPHSVPGPHPKRTRTADYPSMANGGSPLNSHRQTRKR